MKIVGGHYLKVTLKPILDEVQNIPPIIRIWPYYNISFISDLLIGIVYPFTCYGKNEA